MRTLFRLALLATVLLLGLPGCADPHKALHSRCSALAKLAVDGVQITGAELQPAKAVVSGTSMPPLGEGMPRTPDIRGLPAFCRVSGSIRPEPESDIRFEVWLPGTNWDGRLNGGNNAGFAGYIHYPDLAGAVRAGQVGVSTDTGHRAEPMSGDWARGQPARVRDYGWRAIHLSTVAAKQVVRAFYGRGPDKSYFISCSNGGRQGLMAASRFPDDYDGIVAGAPLLMTDVALAMINTVQAQASDAARILPAQIPRLQSEVIHQCDGLDGFEDGLVDDPAACRLDFSRLACGREPEADCFTTPQLDALQRIVDGPRESTGKRVGAGYPLAGAESGGPLPILGWEGWITGTGTRPSAQDVFVSALLANFLTEPFATPITFDFNRDPARLRAAWGDLDVQSDLRRYFDRGGKLILWQGWADAVIPPSLALDYYQLVLRDSGSKAADSVRLFMIPGMQHCGGGTGYGAFGQTSAPQPDTAPQDSVGAAIQAWVEQGRIPDRLIGRRPTISPNAEPANASRLLCAYPARAMRHAGSSAVPAAAYECRVPGPQARAAPP